MATDPFCWRLWWTHADSVALAIGRRIGFSWGKRKDVEGWIANTELTAWLRKTFISILYAAKCGSNCAATRMLNLCPAPTIRR